MQISSLTRLGFHIMRRFLSLITIATLSACSFAPATISVPDFEIPSGSSASFICYGKVTESAPLQFASVVYEGDALYEPGNSLQDNKNITISIYGRSTAPSATDSDVACVQASSEDILLSENITLTANETKRVSAGGSKLAAIVVKDEYWLGAAMNDGTLASLPGMLKFTEGVVKANF